MKQGEIYGVTYWVEVGRCEEYDELEDEDPDPGLGERALHFGKPRVVS